MAKQIVKNAEAAKEIAESAKWDSHKLYLEQDTASDAMNKLSTTHKQRLEIRGRIDKVLLQPDLNDIIESYGLTKIVSSFLSTYHSAEVSREGDMYKIKIKETRPDTNDMKSYDKEKIEAVFNTLGVEINDHRYDRDIIHVNAKQVKELLDPIVQAKRENRPALLEQLWARRDAEELAQDGPGIASAKQRADYLKTLLNPATANGEEKSQARS